MIAFLKFNNIDSIIQFIETFGGSINERNEKIFESIYNIKVFLNNINYGRNDNKYPKLIQKSSLIKQIFE